MALGALLVKGTKAKNVKSGDILTKTYSRSFMQRSFDIDQCAKINIWTPEKHGEGLPLVLVLDGDSLFYPAAEMAAEISEKEGLPAIVAGVGYGYLNPYFADSHPEHPKGRWRDYTFKDDDELAYRSERTIGSVHSRGDEFYAFLKDRLVPDLHSKFSTAADNVTLIGHSYGARFCAHCLTRYDPDDQANPFTKFVMADQAFTRHYERNLPRLFETIENAENAGKRVTTYRIWGEKVDPEGLGKQEKLFRRLEDAQLPGFENYRYYPLGADHAGTQPIALRQGLRIAVGLKPLDYSDSSSYHLE